MTSSLFPHDNVRSTQDALIIEVQKAIDNGKCLVAHAPTGLGKTAATIPIALKKAIDSDKIVFFLTSRHTQHKIAIETLKEIKKKHKLDIVTLDIIGKKWMCPVPGVDTMFTTDFSEYCRKQKEEGKCEQYNNTRASSKPTVEAKLATEQLQKQSPVHIEEFMAHCSDRNLCPYEISILVGGKAKVIVADYYYIFNSVIREGFLGKIDKEIGDCIIIIDEAHNLPSRIRELNTYKINTFILEKAMKEAKKFGFDDLLFALEHISHVLAVLGEKAESKEVLVKKDEFVKMISEQLDYEQVIGDLEAMAEEVRERQKTSSAGSIANFLQQWQGGDEGYARIFNSNWFRDKKQFNLIYRCLDPSITTKEIIKSAYSVIAMSGTLTPAEMYKDLLGMPADTILREYKSPFPKKNKLTMIVPKTTTKFTERSSEQFKSIAAVTADIVNAIPGNTALFFPSYDIKDTVGIYFNTLSKKTVFSEKTNMTKEEKESLLDEFKKYKNTGAALLAVVSGSFGEGIDLPGDYLKGVVVVGLPLSKPDLETQELIKYYDTKFGKGWDYGYIVPAMNKCLQSAGRCIRSETDRGVVIFLDERFAWQNYLRFFSNEDAEITTKYIEKIKEFFGTE